jgi:tight adherence protein B
VTILVITSIVFASLLALFVAIGMVIRDMRLATASGAAPVSIRRTSPVTDSEPAQSFMQKLSVGFDQLIQESGTGMSSYAGLLLMVMSGSLIGGGLFVFENNPVPALLAALVGMLVPLVIIAFVRRRRLTQIEEQIPEALSLMARAVHAGETLEQAVSLAGEDTPEPLGPELRVCANQISLGVSVSRAMESLGRRVRTSDARTLATTLAVHRHSGGNLASTLEHLAGVVRDRSSHRRQLRSATSAGRLSAQFIGAAGPLLFIFLYVFNRAHLTPLLELPLGNVLLLAAAVLEIVGLLWLVQMLRGQNR